MNRADRFMYQAKIQKNMVVTGGRRRFRRGQKGRLDHSEPEKSRSHRVLIVDDSEMNRFLLREMLGPEFEILEAENGAGMSGYCCKRYGTGYFPWFFWIS